MDTNLYLIIPLVAGWLLDKLFGDPESLPHPVVGFGKLISLGEKKLNKGNKRLLKGSLFAVSLILLSYLFCFFAINGLSQIHPYLVLLFGTIMVFYCLAGKTLIMEVRQVFEATEHSVEAGRKQIARIVGRDTSDLNIQQIRTASLETLSENLSDGVIAPLFWFLLLGIPGMFAYKMVNTLDSMLGYKNERYNLFGRASAYVDDIANYIPARLTALLMIVGEKCSGFSFIRQYGHQHASPNSGYPEAALAAILDCRFGGPNYYFGQKTEKPYIGSNNRLLDKEDMQKAISINQKTEILMMIIILMCQFINMPMCQ